jgi:tRNA modification GTPase
VSETIVAVATPPGAGHRAVIRLSGPRAFRIAGAPRRRGDRPARLAGLAVRLWTFPAPASYTRDDVVEIHLVSSPPLVREAVEHCLARGARPAEPGEFTRRAFLNGRLDLAQAEAVLDLITARDADEVRAAAEQLRGAFSREIRAVESSVLDLCADVEAAIDFVDQDIEIVSPAAAERRTREQGAAAARLLRDTAARRVASSKPTVFLVGPPNAGKSALFNRLGGRAIVSDVPGTTRDVLAADAGPVRLCDAPGIWDAEGLDAEAVRRAREEARHADLWLFVVDAADPAPAEALAARAAGRPAILVLNKVDRAPKGLDLRRQFPMGEAVCTSAATGEGVPDLRARLERWAEAAGREGARARFHVSLRQWSHLRQAEEALGRAAQSLHDGLGMEFAALDLRAALAALGAVTGRQASDDLLDRVFERFCVGK